MNTTMANIITYTFLQIPLRMMSSVSTLVKRWYNRVSDRLMNHNEPQLSSHNTLEQPARTPPTRPWTTHDSNLALFECLSEPCGKRRALPPEIILIILAQRSRWVFRDIESYPLTTPVFGGGFRLIKAQGGDEQPILVTRPLWNSDIRFLEHVVFTFSSCDQGWSSYPEHHGTYDQSYTWMEAGICRQDDEVSVCRRFELQRNRHAGGHPEDYRVEIGKDHGLFTLLCDGEEGDKIALWARAMFGGWQNFVHNAKIELHFFGPDDLVER